MGILVCIDDFTYEVIDDASLLCTDRKVVGYDNSCEWEMTVLEEPPTPRKDFIRW